MNWYTIENIDRIDTPSLVLYKERITHNIRNAIQLARYADNLRPHVKTNKIAEVCKMMMDEGISKFKCATIAEAEMLAITGARDVLLAYQPVGPKAQRLLMLAKHYPDTTFSCLADDKNTIQNLSDIFHKEGFTLKVFIDLNTGMNRTGISPVKAYDLYQEIFRLPGIYIEGVHAYDGHLKDSDIDLRQKNSDSAYSEIIGFVTYLQSNTGRRVTIVAGGSPTFTTHVNRNVECSPGTFVFWDWGYKHLYPDQPFDYAALVITRIISIVNSKTITTDLGYKAVASENPLPRVHFLNAPDSNAIAHSEEHLVVQVPDSSKYNVGDVLYF
jgi:D-serine deaminase-like pyridoxal phosphate-dependent protein